MLVTNKALKIASVQSNIYSLPMTSCDCHQDRLRFRWKWARLWDKGIHTTQWTQPFANSPLVHRQSVPRSSVRSWAIPRVRWKPCNARFSFAKRDGINPSLIRCRTDLREPSAQCSDRITVRLIQTAAVITRHQQNVTLFKAASPWCYLGNLTQVAPSTSLQVAIQFLVYCSKTQ